MLMLKPLSLIVDLVGGHMFKLITLIAYTYSPVYQRFIFGKSEDEAHINCISSIQYYMCVHSPKAKDNGQNN